MYIHSSWESFPHEEAPYRAYQYGEDGLFGLCDDQAQLCLSLALWNGKDSILKERLFGLTGPQVYTKLNLPHYILNYINPFCRK